MSKYNGCHFIIVSNPANAHKEYLLKWLSLILLLRYRLRNEIFIMCQLDHPNIVRIEEVYESTNEIYIVQELCLGGELFDRLDEQPDYHYTEPQCARLVKQMLSAVRYLHSNGIIHRGASSSCCVFRIQLASRGYIQYSTR